MRPGRASGLTAAFRSALASKGTWLSLALIAAVAAVFAPVRGYPFINTDDPMYVTANGDVLRGLNLENVIWAFTTGHEPYWHPLTWMSHMLDVQLFGTNAGAHHLVSVLFHAVNSVLLFWLLFRMTSSFGRSAFVAALFALHPLRVESVAWIAERKDVLSTMFWILTTMAYVRYASRRGAGRYAAVVALYALGLMSKPMLVTLPFTLLLLDYWPLRRLANGGRALIVEKIPLFVVAFVVGVVTFAIQRTVGAVTPLSELPVSLRVANAMNSYVTYMADMFWPTRLAAIYPLPDVIPTVRVVLCLAMLVTITALVIRYRRKAPYLPVGWFWYLGTLFPVIGIMQAGMQGRADRFTYVPHIGLFIMIAWGVPDLVRSAQRRWPTLSALRPAHALGAIAVVVIAACGVLSRRQVTYWRSSVVLWERALSVTTANGPGNYALGVEFAAQGNRPRAIPYLQEGAKYMPNFALAQNRLAVAFAQEGMFDSALVHFREVARIQPLSAEAHDNMGIALLELGRRKEAVAAFRMAARLEPRNPTYEAHLAFAGADTSR